MKRVLQLVSNDFEDLELWCPVMRLREAGVAVDLAAEKPGLYHGQYGVPCEAPLSFQDLDAKDYDGILIPGGWAPDKLRRFPKVLCRDPAGQKGHQHPRHQRRHAPRRR